MACGIACMSFNGVEMFFCSEILAHFCQLLNTLVIVDFLHIHSSFIINKEPEFTKTQGYCFPKH